MRRAILAVLFAVFYPNMAIALCTNSDAVWSADQEDEHYVIYGTDGIEYGSKISIEKWHHKQLIWRGHAYESFSNGYVVRRLSFDNASGGTGFDGETDAVLETIDENNDGLYDWITLAAIEQSLHYAGGLKVKWFHGKPKLYDEPITIPDVYRFLACKKNLDKVEKP
jgi:hypothetical protein